MNRNNLRLRLLERLPPHSIGAEIGVWKGDFSAQILDRVKPRELHLIDPWIFQSEYPMRLYGGYHAKNQQDMDKIYQSVRERFQDFPQVIIQRNYSQEALKEFPDHTFDWIYIDGNHGFDSVVMDLELAVRKVKPGGLITGDDYDWVENQCRPTQMAVDYFVEKYGKEILVLGDSQYLIFP